MNEMLEPAMAKESPGSPAGPARRVLPLLVSLLALFPYLVVTVWFLAVVRRPGPDPLIRIGQAYEAYTIWLPLWCAASGLAALIAGHRVRWRALKRSGVFVLLLGGLSSGARIYATHVEPKLLQVRHVRIRTDKVDRPIRLLHVSDIQTDRVGEHDRRAFRKMAELKPDLIVHTGDLLHPIPPATLASELPPMAELWASLDPPLGKWNVVGDTDLHIIPQLRAGGSPVGGLRTLHAEDAVLTVGKTRLRLFGLALAQSRGGQGMEGQVARWLAEGQRDHDFNILFGHAPDYVLHLEGMPRVDLCLAGHTHGGQIRVPFWGPPVTFSGVPRAWARGYHKTKKFRLNVSAGIGAEHHWGLPSIRINCPPEMTLIELVPKETPAKR